MDRDRLICFFLGGIISILLNEILEYSGRLETRNAYQQGVIESQRQWLEYEKGEKW